MSIKNHQVSDVEKIVSILRMNCGFNFESLIVKKKTWYTYLPLHFKDVATMSVWEPEDG